MEIVVKGRNVEVPEHFRQHVSDKLAPAERLDPRAIRLDVELSHEKNPRQSANCQRVEITLRSKGPVIRAEACAESFYAALDTAVLKLEARLRKSHDRRRVHHGGKTPASVATVTATLATAALATPALAAEPSPGAVATLDTAPPDTALPDTALPDTALPDTAPDSTPFNSTPLNAAAASAGVDETALLVVRDKTHTATPMTTADALHEMELVGHDFFLFMDVDHALPSVVYRRHGYDYGVIRLAAS